MKVGFKRYHCLTMPPSGVFFLLLCFLVAGCSNNNNNSSSAKAEPAEQPVPPPTNPYEGYSSPLYDAVDNWICRPDISGEDNACNGDMSATLVFPDGSTQLELYTETENPEVDCFYVYPTVSGDQTPNSDLNPGIEVGVTYIQAARYRSVCKLYVPVYRQFTSAALGAALRGEDVDYKALLDVAYADVRDSFKQFVASTDGRGFILIGHSQGSSHLIRLIQEEIESQAYLSEHMIAAHLIGMVVELPLDAEVGATFESTPPCTFERATACFVNYSSFTRDNPPLDESAFFGVTANDDTRAACTHPVDLGAGQLNLDAYFSPFQLKPYIDEQLNASITTPFVKLPGLIQGECIEQGGKGYLAISVDADPDDPRIDDLGNESRVGWGLHSLDVAMAHGNLVALAQRQADEWLGQQ